jgi:cysteinyl-tRNA synthetase
VVFDVLRRYLEHTGYAIRHVQNFTDIEDRIIEASLAEGRGISAIAEQYIQRFLEEMDALGVQRAHHYPRATEYIERMIEIVKGLIDRGLAYQIDGDVYYRVRAFPSYGRLSRRSLDETEAGTRIDVDPRKDDPMDFALWKASKEGEPAWPSPWGDGRPGWHIECSAMSLSLLGEQFDIHGGGHDVVFPHHENEIAQSEGYTGASPVVRFWVHNGLLRPTEDDQEKMTRSRGNFVSCRDALASHSPDAIRLFLLSSHYRSPRAYSEEEIEAHERAVERIRNALREKGTSGNGVLEAEGFAKRFEDAMDDDLNTPRAVAVLFELTHEINRARGAGQDIEPAQALLQELSGILGLTFEPSGPTNNVAAQPFLDLLVEVRSQLRDARQFALADTIRDRLTEIGVTLEDTTQGTKWRL